MPSQLFLEIHEFQMLSLSWRLIDAFIDSHGCDPEALFVGVWGERVYQRARFALVTDALRANMPRICEQQTVNFPADVGAKLRQTLHFGSREWADTYHRLRNTVEGMNGVAKDGAHAALDDPECRRVRGVAAQTLFAALLLFATNLQKMDSFLAHAIIDTDGVTRRLRRSRRTTRSIKSWTPAIVGRGGATPP